MLILAYFLVTSEYSIRTELARVQELDKDRQPVAGHCRGYSQRLTDSLKKKVLFIAQVLLDPGENEMEALAAGAMRYFNGEE